MYRAGRWHTYFLLHFSMTTVRILIHISIIIVTTMELYGRTSYLIALLPDRFAVQQKVRLFRCQVQFFIIIYNWPCFLINGKAITRQRMLRWTVIPSGDCTSGSQTFGQVSSRRPRRRRRPGVPRAGQQEVGEEQQLAQVWDRLFRQFWWKVFVAVVVATVVAVVSRSAMTIPPFSTCWRTLDISSFSWPSRFSSFAATDSPRKE